LKWKLTDLNAKLGHFLSVSLGPIQPETIFTEIFRRQLQTLQKIEEQDATNDGIHTQVFYFIFILRIRLPDLMFFDVVHTLAIFERTPGLQSF
jgi:hypothetical protein